MGTDRALGKAERVRGSQRKTVQENERERESKRERERERERGEEREWNEDKVKYYLVYQLISRAY